MLCYVRTEEIIFLLSKTPTFVLCIHRADDGTGRTADFPDPDLAFSVLDRAAAAGRSIRPVTRWVARHCHGPNTTGVDWPVVSPCSRNLLMGNATISICLLLAVFIKGSKPLKMEYVFIIANAGKEGEWKK